MKIHLPRSAQYAVKSLTGAGYQAYIVGGSVRDHLLGKTPSDYDVTTSALPEEVMALFAKDRLLTNGLKHGTVTLIKYGQPIEITTFRIDGEYEDGRHPDDVMFTGNLYEDVQRRDFTVNALCWNEQAGLIDYVGGEEDLENKIIRCVGEADVRFNEDALRILRALRFSSVLDFDIEADTARAVHDNRENLSKIAVERILTELKKLLCGARAESILLEYRDVLEVIMPELHALTADDYMLAARRVSLVSPVPELRLAALLSDLPVESANACVTRLKTSKVSRKFIESVIAYGKAPMPTDRAGMRRLAGRCGEELLLGLAEIRAAHITALCHMVVQQGDCVSLKQLAVKGDDLFRLGVTRRMIGDTLNGLLARVVEGELPNEKEALMDAVRADLNERAERAAAEKAASAGKKKRRRRGKGAQSAESAEASEAAAERADESVPETPGESDASVSIGAAQAGETENAARRDDEPERTEEQP